MTPAFQVVPRWDIESAGRLRASMMLLMRIDRWDVRRDGALSEPALHQKVRALGYEPAARLYPAGAIVSAPTDDRDRVQAIARGLVKVTIDGESAILTAGDIVFVPRGAVRRVEVVGSAPAHCLEAVYAGETPGDVA
ncbi:MAG TPA: cupin domain-containing protein [Vicinamibacterales bacterium]